MCDGTFSSLTNRHANTTDCARKPVVVRIKKRQRDEEREGILANKKQLIRAQP
jgi:hypothetical protein